MQESFAFENLPIPKDLFGTHRKTKEQRDDYTHEEVNRDIVVIVETIPVVSSKYVVVLHHESNKKRQYWCFKHINEQILLIGNFCENVTRHEHLQLLEPVRYFLSDRERVADVINLWKTYSLFEVLIPLSRRDFASICVSTILVDDLRLDDREYLFRINISTLGAGALILVRSMDNITEVSDSFDRVSVIDLKAPGVHDDQRVEHLEYIGRWLVDHNKDHLPAKRKFL